MGRGGQGRRQGWHGAGAAEMGARAGASAGAAGRAVGSGARARVALVAIVEQRGQTTRLILRPGVWQRAARPSTARATATHQRYNLMGLCRMGCGRPLHLFKHRCDRCQTAERARRRRL